VSILITTSPGPAITSRDVRRLYEFLVQAALQLEAELPAGRVAGLLDTLRRLATAARRGPVGAGLAIFASDQEQEIVSLPVPVFDRVVIGPTFATRDLLRAQTYLPRLRLLLFSERAARLYEGWPDGLVEVVADGFPIVRHEPRSPGGGFHAFQRDQSRQRGARLAAYLRAVEAALSGRRCSAPLPLIVAGTELHPSFRSQPVVAADLIGTTSGSHRRLSSAQLSRLCQPILQNYLRGKRHDGLARLNGAERRVEGLDAVWRAALEGRVDLLCIEEGYVFTTGPVADECSSTVAAGGASFYAIDDTIDDTIKLVARSGGETVIVDSGALSSSGGIAARLAARPSSSPTR
jgi:hypothetical protein